MKEGTIKLLLAFDGFSNLRQLVKNPNSYMFSKLFSRNEHLCEACHIQIIGYTQEYYHS